MQNSIYTCALNACPNSSQSCLAYCSDFPVSVAYNTVAFILRESARPNNLDVNFTALLNNNNNFCDYCFSHIFSLVENYLAICLKWNFLLGFLLFAESRPFFHT